MVFGHKSRAVRVGTGRQLVCAMVIGAATNILLVLYLL